jgi:hypothetical protein
MLSFSIWYPDLIKFPYFAHTTERGVGCETEGDFMDNSILLSISFGQIRALGYNWTYFNNLVPQHKITHISFFATKSVCQVLDRHWFTSMCVCVCVCVRVILQSCEIVLQTIRHIHVCHKPKKQYLCYVARRKRKLNIYVIIQGAKFKPKTTLIQ